MGKKTKATSEANGSIRNGTSLANNKQAQVLEKPNVKNGRHHDEVKINPIEQLTGILDKKELLRILSEVKNGNFKVRMPIDHVGLSGKICDTINDIIEMNE